MHTIAANDRYEDEAGRFVSLLAKDQYFRALAWTERLSEEEETLLLARVARGNQEREKSCPDQWRLRLAQAARDRLVESYQPLVVSFARRWQHSFQTMELLDLIQEGNLGVLQALDQWGLVDVRCFASLAVARIRRALWLALYGSDRPIHLSCPARDALSRLDKVEHRLSTEVGREPLVSELAHEMQVSEGMILDLVTWRQQGQVASVQHLLPEADAQGYCSFEPLYGSVASSSLSPAALKALACGLEGLSAFQREVVQLRFGLGEQTSGLMTYKDIANYLGTSEQSVAKAESGACQVLKKLLAPYLTGRNQVVPGASCDVYYMPGEVASLLGVTINTVCNYAKAGLLPAVEYHGGYRGSYVRFLFPKQDIDALVPSLAAVSNAYYVAREVAALLGINNVTVLARARAGQLPAVEYHGVYRGSSVRFLFPKQEIDALVASLPSIGFRGKRFVEREELSA